jgi:hypothetical protein
MRYSFMNTRMTIIYVRKTARIGENLEKLGPSLLIK